MGNRLPLWLGILAVVLISAVFFVPRLVRKASPDRPQPRRLAKRVPQEESSGKDPLLSAMTPSLLGIAVCMVCLCGLSWAWFTVDIDSAPNTMMAAYYDVSVAITASGTDVPQNPDGSYSLTPKAAGNGYTVTITAGGTASRGYCRISGGGSVYYTPMLNQGSSFTFTLYPYAGDYTFEAVWGALPSEATPIDPATPVGAPLMTLMHSPDLASPSDTDSEASPPDSETGSEATPTDPVTAPEVIPTSPEAIPADGGTTPEATPADGGTDPEAIPADGETTP